MPDDHSELVPLLPIPNRTVKRLSADDSADARVKVGHRQALTAKNAPPHRWGVCFRRSKNLLKKTLKSVLQCKASLIAAGWQSEGCGIFKNIQPISVGV